MKYSCARTIFILTVLVLGRDVYASSFCEHYLSPNADSAKRDPVVVSVCGASFDDFEGTFAYFERGFLPIPKQFYIKPPGKNDVLMSSAQFADRIDWPYGILTIGSFENSQIGVAKSAHKIDHEVIEEVKNACGLNLELWNLLVEMPDSEFSSQFTEAKFGNTLISLSGDSEQLMLAMIDSFVRLNCKGNRPNPF